VVVPAVGVVVGDDDGRARPIGRALERVEGARDEVLLVERVGVRRVGVLERRCLQERDLREVSVLEGRVEVLEVVLVVDVTVVDDDDAFGTCSSGLNCGEGGVVRFTPDLRALDGATTNIVMAMGRRCTPASSAEYPITNWKYCVRRKIDPNIAKNRSMIPPLAALNLGFDQNEVSSIGWAVRDSHTQNAPSTRKDRAKVARVAVDVQPFSGAWMMA